MKSRNGWLIAGIVVSLLPIGAYPAMVGALGTGEDVTTLVKLYPAALVGYALCAWLCRRDRIVLSWILVALSLLSSASLLVPMALGVGPYAH